MEAGTAVSHCQVSNDQDDASIEEEKAEAKINERYVLYVTPVSGKSRRRFGAPPAGI